VSLVNDGSFVLIREQLSVSETYLKGGKLKRKRKKVFLQKRKVKSKNRCFNLVQASVWVCHHLENTERIKRRNPTLERLPIYFWPFKRLWKTRKARKTLGDEIVFRMIGMLLSFLFMAKQRLLILQDNPNMNTY
jgi:hypothetical protein